MNKEFVMRGKTASGSNEVLNFSGNKPGYGYRMTEFQIFPSSAVGASQVELSATVTAAKTAESPNYPNFQNDGLIANAFFHMSDSSAHPMQSLAIVNDTFIITQNLILAVIDTQAGSPQDVNWQCRFVAEKMSKSEEAVTNYKQYTISDE